MGSWSEVLLATIRLDGSPRMVLPVGDHLQIDAWREGGQVERVERR